MLSDDTVHGYENAGTACANPTARNLTLISHASSNEDKEYHNTEISDLKSYSLMEVTSYLHSTYKNSSVST